MQRSFKQTSTQKGQDFHATGTLPHNKSLLETPGTVKDKFQYLQVDQPHAESGRRPL